MVSEKPPRRSRKNDEPVTIDLTASEVQKPDAQKTSEEGAAQASVEGHEPAPAAPEAGTQEEKPATEMEPSGREDAATASSFGSPDGTPRPEDAPDAEAQNPPDDNNIQPRTRPTSTSALLAAGIAGGLIALIGAGAVQYAGLLPGASAPREAAGSAALSAEVQSLKAELARQAGAKSDLSSVEERLKRLESAATPADVQAMNDVQAKIAAANQALDSLRSETTGRLQSLTQSQTDLGTRIETIENKLNRPRDDIEVARAIAASALKTAVDRGGPFLAEMTTLKGIVPEEPALPTLEKYATTGVASRTELLRRFAESADHILAAINQPAESANIAERLWASAASVVKVRPVGNVEGASPYAIVARIEDKIRNGDLKGAASEWESLPEAGRSASGDFKKQLDERIAVEAAVSDAMARAVNGRQG
ncbi:COG4223 family protein [Allorhizobium undicola]|uniref:COG4223 family protein n=1 Tax=Allorhizobium undicola TaxID=78527 RepID=UPI003D33CCD3